MNRYLSLCLLFAALLPHWNAAAYELGDFDIHGTFSQGFIHSKHNNFVKDTNDGTFDFREFGINATTFVGERITLGAQLFGRKLGSVGDDKITLDWISASYRLNDAVGLRAGKLKMPYGLYGETRDIDSLRTQVLLPQSVYVESYRGSINAMWGAQVFGSVGLGAWGSLDYSVQQGRSAVDVDSGELNRLANYLNLEADSANDDEAGALKLLWSSAKSNVRAGSTLSWSSFSVDGRPDSLLGVPGQYRADLDDQMFLVNSIEYSIMDTTIAAEYLLSDFQGEFAFTSVPVPPIKLRVKMSGYYVSIDRQVADMLTLGGGYSSLSVSQRVEIFGVPTKEQERFEGIYATLRYDVTPNLNVKLEQHFNKGRAILFAVENPDGFDDDWSMTLVKATFLF